MSFQNANALPLSVPELKLLLSLVTFPDYQAPGGELRVSAKTSTAERHRLCDSLQQKGLVDYEKAVTRFGLTAAGRTLLTLDTSVLPITPDERYVLRSCQGGSIGPGHIASQVPKDRRQSLIATLAQRGLLKVTQRHIETVWLTDAGQQFLRHECTLQGNTPILSLTQMSQYLHFMRQGQSLTPAPTASASKATLASPEVEVTPNDLLQVITHLDTVLNTDNYLPIYHLREELQPPLTRRSLDQRLYQLQRENRIDLSTLQDVSQYRKSEIAAGIPQDIGGPLFFISVL